MKCTWLFGVLALSILGILTNGCAITDALDGNEANQESASSASFVEEWQTIDIDAEARGIEACAHDQSQKFDLTMWLVGRLSPGEGLPDTPRAKTILGLKQGLVTRHTLPLYAEVTYDNGGGTEILRIGKSLIGSLRVLDALAGRNVRYLNDERAKLPISTYIEFPFIGQPGKKIKAISLRFPKIWRLGATQENVSNENLKVSFSNDKVLWQTEENEVEISKLSSATSGRLPEWTDFMTLGFRPWGGAEFASQTDGAVACIASSPTNATWINQEAFVNTDPEGVGYWIDTNGHTCAEGQRHVLNTGIYSEWAEDTEKPLLSVGYLPHNLTVAVKNVTTNMTRPERVCGRNQAVSGDPIDMSDIGCSENSGPSQNGRAPIFDSHLHRVYVSNENEYVLNYKWLIFGINRDTALAGLHADDFFRTSRSAYESIITNNADNERVLGDSGKPENQFFVLRSDSFCIPAS